MLPQSLKANTQLCYWVRVKQVFLCIKLFVFVCMCECEEKYRTHNLLECLRQTQSTVGRVGVISESIQKIIHCKYIIYIYTFLNIFTNIPSTIHYTVYFSLQNNWEGLGELKKEMHQYYKINRRAVPICTLLLFLCFVSWSSVSQSISYLSSSSSPLFLFQSSYIPPGANKSLGMPASGMGSPNK